MIQKQDINQFEKDGYFIAEDLLNFGRDIQPVIDEYDDLLDELATKWYEEGRISNTYRDLDFGQKISQIAQDTDGLYTQALDISLPQKDISNETPMHHGPAVFQLLRNERLLDAIEVFIGPEIFSNPVQHVRIKPPENYLPEAIRKSSLAGQTLWHQDQGVVTEEADESNILTVWIPMTDATEENGCLVVGRGSHKDGLGLHCYTNNPEKNGLSNQYLPEDQVSIIMSPGDVLFMTKMTKHSSLPNVSEDIRWSFDLRYNPTGEATGRRWFPGFVARSKSNPDSELHDPFVWGQRWDAAREQLYHSGVNPQFQRWDPNDPLCA